MSESIFIIVQLLFYIRYYKEAFELAQMNKQVSKLTCFSKMYSGIRQNDIATFIEQNLPKV